MTHVSNATFMPVDPDQLDQHLCGYMQLSTQVTDCSLVAVITAVVSHADWLVL